MLFDTHAHMDDRAFDADRTELLTTSLPQAGIALLMNPGCSAASSEAAATLPREYDYIYAAVGSHPDAADEVNDAVLDRYRQLCRENPKIKAVGEIGLDYHYEDIPRDIQKKAFVAQMELARELKKPVIVHEREAHQDGMEIVTAFPEVTGVFHCFSAPPAFPRARVLMETDCPYMSPEPFRGKRNDPTRLYRMAEALASLWGISPEEAQAITFENGKRLYGI